VIENRPGAVNIKRRAEIRRGPDKIDIFAVKSAVAITKRVHGRM